MNRDVKDCDIVLELLPLYIEQKTGEESNLFVEKHLTECTECREIHGLMSADWLENIGQKKVEGKEAPQRGRNKVFWVVAGILAYAGLMAGFVVYMFFYLTGM